MCLLLACSITPNTLRTDVLGTEAPVGIISTTLDVDWNPSWSRYLLTLFFGQNSINLA